MLNKRILTLVFVVAFLTLLVGCLPSQNETPIITSDPVKIGEVGVDYTYDVDATDPDEDVLTYSLVTKPTGMAINSATGLIKWTPTAKGVYSVVVKVSDGDLDITQSFIITVIEEEEEPSPTPTPTKYYTITATADPGGSINPSGNVIVNKGSNKTFTITPDTNYIIADVLVDTNSEGAVGSYTFNNVTANHTIQATFEEKTVTINWLEDAIRYNNDGTYHSDWSDDPIGPAILICDDGGYYLANVDEFFNVFMTPEMEPEGGITIDETGLLTGWAKYSLHKLPTENDFVGQVEIVVYDDGNHGTMIGTYTQFKYAYGTAEEVKYYYKTAVRCEGFVDKWFVQYTDYIAHE